MLRNLNKVFPSIFLKGRCKFSISTLPKEEKIKVGDWCINHAIDGTGPHYVLCMPANFGSLSIHFKHQFEDLDREKFTLVAWDQPGFGKSRPPNRHFSVDMYERDAELAHELMKIHGLELTVQYGAGWVDAIFEIYKTRDGNICDALLKDIKCPTLLLYGESDKLVDKSHPEHIHKNIKNSRNVTIQANL